MGRSLRNCYGESKEKTAPVHAALVLVGTGRMLVLQARKKLQPVQGKPGACQGIWREKAKGENSRREENHAGKYCDGGMSMKLEWPKNQEFRPSDMIPVTHNGTVIGLLKAIHEYGVEVVVWKENAGLELMDDKIVACEILSEPHDY